MCHPSESVDPPPLEGARRRDLSIELAGGEALPVRLAIPVGALRGLVVIVTDIYGANAFYRSIADRLAVAGFAALLPDFFFREGALREPTRELAFERRALLDDERAIRDLGSACDWGIERGEISGGRVGTLGFCLGGNLVLNLCTRRSDLATVSYYGFPAGLPAPKAVVAPIQVVEKLAGPILAFWGERDEKVGMEHVDAFARAIDGTDLAYEQHVYPDVEHGFLAGLEGESDPAHEAATDAWRRSLAFFEAHLRAPEPKSLGAL